MKIDTHTGPAADGLQTPALSKKQSLNQTQTKLLLSLAFIVFAAIAAAALAALPYSTGRIENLSVAAAERGLDAELSIGSFRWDVDAYAGEERLEPLREYFNRTCRGRSGVDAALCISDDFAARFPFGNTGNDIFNVEYDPIATLRAHLNGEPGHCVTRSGLTAAILLASGTPARVVQLMPAVGKGHNAIEVWEQGRGWALVDPSCGVVIGNDDGPCSAVAALRAPDKVRPVKTGNGGAVIEPERFYGREANNLFGGYVSYPEPWLYLRAGKRDGVWPLRARFVFVGARHWTNGLGQTVLQNGIALCLAAGGLSMLSLLLSAPRSWRANAAYFPRFLSNLVGGRMSRQPNEEFLNSLRTHLRCPACARELTAVEAHSSLTCSRCDEQYPIVDGIPRMLSGAMRRALADEQAGAQSYVDERRVATAQSFGFEWNHFPEMRAEWEKNFWDYFVPHSAEAFRGKRVLDAGCGSGRHSFYAAKSGAEVWAVDLGSAVEVARRNNAEHSSVHVAQADLHHLPFAAESFDMVYSIGVLHHLSDPEAVFRNLLRYVKPGGRIHVYLYWKPEGQPIKRALLAGVTAIRRITTSIPHRLLYGLSYPAAAIAFAGFVWPYQLLSAAGLSGIAERLPMKQYAQYPFRVCVNDQFDRFSAPIEHRYTRAEVTNWLERAGLEEISVKPNYGWCATGRKSEERFMSS